MEEIKVPVCAVELFPKDNLEESTLVHIFLPKISQKLTLQYKQDELHNFVRERFEKVLETLPHVFRENGRVRKDEEVDEDALSRHLLSELTKQVKRKFWELFDTEMSFKMEMKMMHQVLKIQTENEHLVPAVVHKILPTLDGISYISVKIMERTEDQEEGPTKLEKKAGVSPRVKEAVYTAMSAILALGALSLMYHFGYI